MSDLAIHSSRELTPIIRKCILTDDYKAGIMCATIDDAISVAGRICDEFRAVRDNLKTYMPDPSCVYLVTENIIDEGTKIIFENGSSIDCVAVTVIAWRDSELILWPHSKRTRDTEYNAVIVGSGFDLTDVKTLRMIFTNPQENEGIHLSVNVCDTAALTISDQRDIDTSQELDSFLAGFKITKGRDRWMN